MSKDLEIVPTAEVVVVDLVSTLDRVREQISAYENATYSKEKSKTKGERFQFNPSKTNQNAFAGIDLSQTSLSSLVSIHAFLLEKQKAFSNSARILLGEDSELKFLWQGFSFEDWEADIVSAIQVQKMKGKISLQELKNLEQEILQNLTAADKKRQLESKLSKLSI